MTSVSLQAVPEPMQSAPRPSTSKTPHRLILVANRTGGQGKTLVSQLMLHYLAKKHRPVVPLAADAQSGDVIGAALNDRTFATAEGSKLSRVLNGAKEYGIGRSASLGGGAADVLGHWDELGAMITSVDTLLDVGANVIDAILDWAKAADARDVLADLLVVDLVVPVTRSTQSIKDAASMIGEVLIAKSLPLRNIYIVRNRYGANDVPEAAVNELVADVRKLIRKGAADAAKNDQPKLLTGDVALLDLKTCDTTSGTRLVSDFDAQLRYLGVADYPIARDSAEDDLTAVACPLDGLPDSIVLDGGKRFVIREMASAMRAKIAADRTAYVAQMRNLNTFQRSRDVATTRVWLDAFTAEMERVRFSYGHPLVDIGDDRELQFAQMSAEALEASSGAVAELPASTNLNPV